MKTPCFARPFVASDAAEWNDFLARANTPLFLFHRNFMSYHAERFCDESLLIYSADKKLCALFPAHRSDGVLYAHAGLSFGACIVLPYTPFAVQAAIWRAVGEYAVGAGIAQVVVKPVPFFLHRVPDAAAEYILTACGAAETQTELNAVIDLHANATPQERKHRRIVKAQRAGVGMRPASDTVRFWALLTANLEARFGIQPVHTHEEISRLYRSFPDHLYWYEAVVDTIPIAGALLFDYGQCLHAQYIFSTEAGRKYGAVDLLFADLIATHRHTHRRLSLGISNTRQGYRLNTGLLEWKQGWRTETWLHKRFVIASQQLVQGF